jgi:hypothetical protein
LLALPAAVGSFRLSDSAGAYIDRAIGEQGPYYLRIGNALRVDVGVEFYSSELLASYGLRLMPDQNDHTIAPFHTGELRYTYASPRFTFSSLNFIGIGQQTFTGTQRISSPGALAPQREPGVTAPTTPTLATPGTIDATVVPGGSRTLDAVSARAGASVNYRFERRLRMTAVASYGLFGGLGHESQQYLTLQHSIDASLALAYDLTPRFMLISALMGTRGWNPTDPTSPAQQDFWLFTLSETGLYSWSRDTSMDLGVGVSSRATDTPAEGGVIVNTPVGSAGITHTLRARAATGSLRASVTYAPMVDAVTARLQNHFIGTGTATIATDEVRAGVNASISQVVPTDDPQASTVLSGSVFGGFQFTTWLGASLGVAVTKQHFTSTRTEAMTPTASGVTWSVFAGLFAVSPTWRF